MPSFSFILLLLAHGAWLSLVEHLAWDQGVAGSNPAAPTTLYTTLLPPVKEFFYKKKSVLPLAKMIQKVYPTDGELLHFVVGGKR